MLHFIIGLVSEKDSFDIFFFFSIFLFIDLYDFSDIFFILIEECIFKDNIYILKVK